MEYRLMKYADLDLVIQSEYKNRETEPDVLFDFNEETFRKGFLNHNIEKNPSNDTILCIHNGEIIGRIDLVIELSYFDFEKVGYVDWVYVQKPYRKQGIAKKLFDLATTYFEEVDCKLFYLFVAKNEEAQAFYKSIDVEIKTIERAHKNLNKKK